MNKEPLLLLLALLLLLTGCASTKSTVVASFEDVSSDADTTGFWGYRQTKAISLAGLLPTLRVGELCQNSKNRSPATNICFAPGSNNSYYRTRTVGADVTQADVINVRERLMAMVAAAEKLLDRKLTLVKDDLARVRLSKLNTEEGGEPPKDSVAVLTNTERNSLVTQLNTDNSEFYCAVDNVMQGISKPGIFVFQWSADSSISKQGGLGEILGGGGIDQERWNGFGVLGGLKVSTLFVGKDILTEHWPNARQGGFNRWFLKMSTTLYQAKFLAYFSTMDRVRHLAFQLKATIEELTKLHAMDPTWLATQKLDLALTLSKMQKVTNTSLMGSGTVTITPIQWNEPYPKENEPSEKEWLTIYQVATKYKDLKQLLK